MAKKVCRLREPTDQEGWCVVGILTIQPCVVTAGCWAQRSLRKAFVRQCQ